jgi:hypothetical protein
MEIQEFDVCQAAFGTSGYHPKNRLFFEAELILREDIRPWSYIHDQRLCPFADVQLPVLLRVLCIYQANSMKNLKNPAEFFEGRERGFAAVRRRSVRRKTLLAPRALCSISRRCAGRAGPNGNAWVVKSRGYV